MVGIHLLFKNERRIPDIYFAGLILTLCIRIGKSVLYYFFPETDQMVLQLGLSACVFIGPFFYLYLKALNQQKNTFEKKDAYLLFALLIGVSVVGVIYPYRVYPEYWNPEIVQGIYVVWAIFLILGLIQAYKLLGGKLFLFWNLKSEQQYLGIILFGITFITVTYQLALYVGFTYLWGAFIFSVIFYVIAFRALSKEKSVTPKSSNRKLANGEEMFAQIQDLVSGERLYLKQELKLEDISNRTGFSRHDVSQVLNDIYGFGYTHYIRELRVNESKQLIASRPELSLEGIGYEAGFKSKSVFFEAFKKTVGCTPATYKKRLESQDL